MRVGKYIVPVAAMAMGVLALAGSGAQAQQREPGGALTVAASASGTVKAIDAGKRTVTIESGDGVSETIKCGEDVRNFDQIKVGDEVKAAVFERLVVGIGKGEAANEKAGAMIVRAPKGAMPGALICESAAVTAKIDSIDAAKRTVTVEGAEGQQKTFKVADDVDLSAIKQGDDVTLRVTKGLALWVERGGSDAARPAAETLRPGDGAAAIAGATAVATVEAIDAEKRLVTLKGPQGNSRTIHLGKECINFNQIKVGDQVRATIAEEVAVALSKEGAAPSADAEAVVGRAAPGEKPGVVIAESAQLTGKIDSVDAAKGVIALTESDGTTRKIKAGPKIDLSALKAGDDVTLQVTKGLSIVVQAP